MRTIALRFPDWPVYVVACAQGWDLLAPAAVVDNHRIAAANRAARHAGVRVGMKARHSLGVCPSLTVAEEDADAEATAHEEVLTGLEQVTASVETLRPGLLAVPAGSLTRYYGSEEKAVELLVDAAARAGVDCVPGVADDLVSAVWASFTGAVRAPGASAAWVAAQPVGILTAEPVLGAPTVMVETLSDLGIRTLADFAALPRRDVVGRFGADAATWHRIAAGEPERTGSPVQVRGRRLGHVEPEEPVTSTEAAAFLARRAAAQLHAALAAAGSACLRLSVTATLAPPEGYTGPASVERLWRCREPLGEEDTAQRIRWQLDGWLTRVNGRGGDTYDTDGGAGTADAAGIRSVTLTPVECVPAGEVVETLWGGPDDGIRAARAAAARAQALIGTRAVLRPVHRGGHTVTGGVVTVPYGEEDPEEVQALSTRHWEGAVPAPLPGLLASGGGKVHLLDGAGAEVQVSGRGLLSAAPDRLVRGDRGGRSVTVTGWAGPWPVDERWWEASSARRYARLQIATDEPGAHLLLCRDSSWIIEGSY
ncbi:Y-family DNA polymerase [Corynebacterium variabile]|uniref:Y-family DNA polymerase n=1 Tax=Corynebacterium variabile TaxID=1727 RepID=UPI00264A332D|nr:DNA polymerase Y family protein [Corynebacterium variabile]MDN6477902.1 DNA polymerase Y family protein [Corynebacterium variabile]